MSCVDILVAAYWGTLKIDPKRADDPNRDRFILSKGHAATTLYAAAYMLRKNGSRTSGQTCALAGYTIAAGSAWLGGDLVYDQRIGVNHASCHEAGESTE